MRISTVLSNAAAFILVASCLSYSWVYAQDSSTNELADEFVNLSTVTVGASASEGRLQDLTTSALILDDTMLDALTASSLDGLAGAAPGLTWAGGTSRSRYFQMRGIGEVSQFPGEGPPNFSVGLLFDDLDFSGMGLPASTFDVGEVEILRGPQAAIYGSRAMAGLISLRGNEPTSYWERRAEVGVGSDDYLRSGVVVSGPLSRDAERLQARIVLEHLQQNGYRKNVFLGRDDTNNRDETTGRLKLRWQPSDAWQFDLTSLLFDFDNGYDAFTPDNDPEKTYSDKPGKDSRSGGGAALRARWSGAQRFSLLSISSYLENDSVYSYDADWGNDAFWAAAPYFWNTAVEGYPYDFFERLDRERQMLSQDLRLMSTPDGALFGGRSSWQVGLYGSMLNEKDHYDNGFRVLRSDYEALSSAVYGLLHTRLQDRLILHTSLRVEQRETDYDDNEGVMTDRSDTMWGGRVSLESPVSESLRIHGAISRGFKGSGVNQNPALPANKRTYDEEVLWNAEIGAALNLPDQGFSGRLTAFYMLRDSLQIGSSAQFDPADPTAFVYFTDNAADGFNRGIELELNQRLLENLEGFASVSLLDTEYENFESAGGINQIAGREQPYAPSYSAFAGLHWWVLPSVFVRAEVEARDGFYFAAGHDGEAEAYELLHLKAGWQGESWYVTVRGRNVLDETYATQGYQFGLEPPDYPEKLFLTYGDPAQVDITIGCHW